MINGVKSLAERRKLRDIAASVLNRPVSYVLIQCWVSGLISVRRTYSGCARCPRLQGFIGHVQLLGNIHHPMTTLGHLLDCFRLEFGRIYRYVISYSPSQF
jgi:hypothetical protein